MPRRESVLRAKKEKRAKIETGKACSAPLPSGSLLRDISGVQPWERKAKSRTQWPWASAVTGTISATGAAGAGRSGRRASRRRSGRRCQACSRASSCAATAPANSRPCRPCSFPCRQRLRRPAAWHCPVPSAQRRRGGRFERKQSSCRRFPQCTMRPAGTCRCLTAASAPDPPKAALSPETHSTRLYAIPAPGRSLSETQRGPAACGLQRGSG